MLVCFISHTWHEGGHHFAMRLANALKEKIIEVWIDEKGLLPSCHLKETIERGIKHESDVFLFVISPEALKSKWCKYELNLAIKQMEENGKPIIPVLFKKCEIPIFLRNICYADFMNPQYFDAAVERLVKGIMPYAEIGQIYVELNHPNPEERIKASEKLRELKNPITLGPLKNRFLSKEFDPTVKYWLAMAIGEIDGTKSLEILSQAMAEEDPYARLGVCESMSVVYNSLDEKEFSQALNILFEAINSKNQFKRLCAIKILIGIKRKSEKLESIICSLTNDPDKNIRTIVKEHLRRKGEL